MRFNVIDILATAGSVASLGTSAIDQSEGFGSDLALATDSNRETELPTSHGHRVVLESNCTFHPRRLVAALGETIIFELLGNQSVRQSTWEEPCRPRGAFESGYLWNESGTRTVELLVTTTAPQWYFCSLLEEVTSCEPDSLFAINPQNSSDDVASKEDYSTTTIRITSTRYITSTTHISASTAVSGSSGTTGDERGSTTNTLTGIGTHSPLPTTASAPVSYKTSVGSLLRPACRPQFSYLPSTDVSARRPAMFSDATECPAYSTNTSWSWPQSSALSQRTSSLTGTASRKPLTLRSTPSLLTLLFYAGCGCAVMFTI